MAEARYTALQSARKFNQEHGRDPTQAELSQESGLPHYKLERVLSMPKEPLSMDAAFGPDNDTTLGEFVSDPHATSPIDEISARHVEDRIRALLATLKPREQEVLSWRFGIDRPQQLTLEEIGKRFSLSRERIRQIESEALAKLRKQADAEDLVDHLLVS